MELINNSLVLDTDIYNNLLMLDEDLEQQIINYNINTTKIPLFIKSIILEIISTNAYACNKISKIMAQIDFETIINNININNLTEYVDLIKQTLNTYQTILCSTIHDKEWKNNLIEIKQENNQNIYNTINYSDKRNPKLIIFLENLIKYIKRTCDKYNLTYKIINYKYDVCFIVINYFLI